MSVEKNVELLIKKGFDSPRKGWVMSEILKSFNDSDREKARNYILKWKDK